MDVHSTEQDSPKDSIELIIINYRLMTSAVAVLVVVVDQTVIGRAEPIEPVIFAIDGDGGVEHFARAGGAAVAIVLKIEKHFRDDTMFAWVVTWNGKTVTPRAPVITRAQPEEDGS